MKRIRNLRDNKGFATILGIILALAIISFLLFIMLNTFFKKPTVDKQTDRALKEQGVDTSNYQTIKDTTRKNLEDITSQHLNQLDNLEHDLSQ